MEQAITWESLTEDERKLLSMFRDSPFCQVNAKDLALIDKLKAMQEKRLVTDITLTTGIMIEIDIAHALIWSVSQLGLDLLTNAGVTVIRLDGIE